MFFQFEQAYLIYSTSTFILHHLLKSIFLYLTSIILFQFPFLLFFVYSLLGKIITYLQYLHSNQLNKHHINRMKSSLIDNPDTETLLPVCCAPLIRATRILFFQFIAAGIVTYGTMVSYNPAFPAGNSSQCAFISLAMFFAFVISGQLSGGHGNPIITIALIFTKGSNINGFKLIIYILAQYIGAIVGAAIAYGTVSSYGCAFPLPYQPGVAFALQLLGSLLFVILYLFIMCGATKLENNFWSYILVPIAFYISKMLTNQFVGLNPAAVFANQLFLGIKITNFETLANYWVYIVAPVVGCIVGSIVFNYFALPVYRTIKNKK